MVATASDELREDWVEWRGRVDATLPHLATKAGVSEIAGRLDSFATKADLQEAINALTWRLIGAMIAVATLIVLALRLWPS